MLRLSLLTVHAARRTCLAGRWAGGGVALLAVAMAGAGCGVSSLDGIDPTGGGGSSVMPGRIGTGGTGADDGLVACEGDGSNAATKSLPPGFMTPSSPIFDGLVTAAEPPPPISGGTLLVLRDGKTAVAGDADRDRVYVVDVVQQTVRASIPLMLHDEPGRLVQDAAGMVHVVLRGPGLLATIDPAAGKVTQRRAVCSIPRGLAYDPVTDRLHVACGGGELVTFTPTGTTAERTLKYQQDLRDVVVDGSRLMVTRFRSAEVMVLDGAGTMMNLIHLPSFTNPNIQSGASFEPSVAWRATQDPDGGMVMVHQRGKSGRVGSTPGGYGGLGQCDSIVHSTMTRVKHGERPVAGPAFPGFVLPVDVAVSPDGKRVAMVAAGNGHVQSADAAQRLFVTDMDDVTQEWKDGCGSDGRHGPGSCPPPGGALGGALLPPNPDGTCPDMFTACLGGCLIPGLPCDAKILGIAGTGGTTGMMPSDQTGAGGASGTGAASGGSTDTGMATAGGASVAGAGGVGGAGGVTMGGTGAMTVTGEGPTMGGAGGRPGGTGGAPANCQMQVPNSVEPVSVAFTGDGGTVLVQTREPAELFFVTGNGFNRLTLSQESRADTGHSVFHSNSGGGLACASCHPEGHEDGRVWTFACEGSRRTQDIGGGLSGTEPFHWNGDLGTFPKLVDTVFVGRMSGPSLSREQTAAALTWINSVPARTPLRPLSDPAVARGKALFESAAVGCATCHTGAALTNNKNADVATSESFQVPSLRGLAGRAPFMHDGCAPTLMARFTDTICGGGEAHGKTAQLTAPQLADLVGYLESL